LSPLLPLAERTIVSAFAWQGERGTVSTASQAGAPIARPASALSNRGAELTDFCYVVGVELDGGERHALVDVNKILAVVDCPSAGGEHELLDALLHARVHDGLGTLNVNLLTHLLARPSPWRGRVEDGGRARLLDGLSELVERGEVGRVERPG